MTVRQPRNATSAITLPADSFGVALKFLRKRARLTQDELGRAVGYSREQIARLENGSRLPDLTMLAALFVAALGLQQEPALVARLLELAGAARQAAAPDETPLRVTVTHQVQQRVEVRQTVIEPTGPPLTLPAPAPVHQLPVPLLPLLGRALELTQACQLLATEARLLTLVGAPGVGKSRLALAIGHQLAPTFAHGAALVLLAGVQDPADVAATVAAALQITPAATQAPADAVRAYLAGRQLLLILDNCEHLLDAMPLLSTWLAAAPRLTVLCTSRVALDLYGEYEMAVGPLARPDLAHLPPLAELGQISAVKLFVDRARAVDHTFQLDAENRLAVAGLAVALDGLPLALELAAARTRTLTPQALLQQLMNARQSYQSAGYLLTQNKRDIAAHHRTLQAAIDWSYRLLSPAEQVLFARLGVFWGGCTAEAVAAVTDGDVITLNGLVTANLVQRAEGLSMGTSLPRLLLLETLRTFALEQLALQGQLVSLQRRHATYFADYAQQIFTEIRGAAQADWLQRARLDHDNFRAALRFALQHEWGEVAVAIAGGLWWFWNRQGLLAEGSRWLAAALDAPCQAGAPTLLHQQQRGGALNGAGSLATEQSRFAEAHTYHLAGLTLRRVIGDQAGVADVLHNLGLLARCEGDYGQAFAWFEEGRALSAALNSDPGYLVMDDVNLAITAYEMGDLAAADRWAAAAYQRAAGHADQWIVAYVTTVLAEIMSAREEWARTETLATAASRLYEQLGDAQFLPEPLLLLAKTAYARGDLAQAEALCQQVLLAYRALDDQYGIANVLYLQAWLTLATVPNVAEPALAITAATCLYEQAYTLRAGVNRMISPREQAEYACLAAALKKAETVCR